MRTRLEEMGGKDMEVVDEDLGLTGARYAADRARRQYDASDPENRRVTGELEARWNAALEHVAELDRRIEKEEAAAKNRAMLMPEDFRELASDLPRVWCDPTTDIRLKKRIVRTLIEEIIVDVEHVAREVKLLIHWKGGVHAELNLPIRQRGQNSVHHPSDTVKAVRLLSLITSDDHIASWLNRNGLRTGKGNDWTRERVTSLRSKGTRGIAPYSAERKEREGWMNLTEAAAFLRVAPLTLRRALDRGDIPGKHPLPDGPWILNRADLQGPAGERLQERTLHRGGEVVKLPLQNVTLFHTIT
jgi:hypothetical protein